MKKIEIESLKPQTLTCTPHEYLLCGTPTLVWRSSCLYSMRMKQLKVLIIVVKPVEVKDEFVLSWQKSDGTNEKINICIKDEDWLL